VELYPRDVIAATLAGEVDMHVPPRAMHDDLKPWQVEFEGGHSVVVAADSGALGNDRPLEKLSGQLLPAPLRTVERVGWRLEKGFIVSPVPMHPIWGSLCPTTKSRIGDVVRRHLASGLPSPAQLALWPEFTTSARTGPWPTARCRSRTPRAIALGGRR
jgi:hypothetical protein